MGHKYFAVTIIAAIFVMALLLGTTGVPAGAG